MASESQFFDNYLLLKPEEANVFELIRLLFSSQLEGRRFIECLEPPDLGSFWRRWLIFVSIVAQKLLLIWNTPLAKTGNVLVMWLNLLSCNGGLFKLLLNLLKGEVIWPERSSATYVSLLGNFDWRIELDKNIRAGGDKKYKALLSVMAAKFSYENEAFIKKNVEEHWQMEFLGFYNFWNDYQGDKSTQAFILQDKWADPNLVVVAFRGTDPFDSAAWRADVDISWYEIKNVGQAHSGFMKALGLQRDQGWPKEIEPSNDGKLFAYYTLRQKLKDILQGNEQAKFIMTGHSLGGALAILFVAVLALHEEELLLERLEGVYTFGQPRVGDGHFGEYMKEKMEKYEVKYFRFVYCNDMVPRLPYDDKTLMFKHFGRCLYFNSCYEGEVLGEEPNKNYFSLLWVIPKDINAVWELIRGFIIPYVKGPVYREGWLMKAWRLVGLVIPGLSAHAPQDYVNSTRLGSLPLDVHPKDQIHQELKRD